MEEFDELMPTPDADGRLELSHRAWQHVDEVVWTMGLEITALSLAYNRLAHIAPELGDLKLLRELDCSCNKLQALPAKIGALRQLRKLKCNGNSLEHLPDEIGQCRQLEEIICSENKLVALPRALGTCKKLRILLAQNNSLAMCPPTLADVSASLEHINLAGNPRLDMIPKKIRGDTELILWVIRLHRDNEVESQYVLSCIDTLEGISRGATERHRELRLELKKVDEDRLELLRNLPTGIDKVLVIYEYLLKKAKTKKCVIS